MAELVEARLRSVGLIPAIRLANGGVIYAQKLMFHACIFEENGVPFSYEAERGFARIGDAGTFTPRDENQSGPCRD